MAFLIDGFNLLYKFPEFEGMMYANRLDDARIGLLNLLKQYVKISGKHVRIVFDGKKQPSLEIKRERYASIDVYYSLDYSADYLIKQFIKKDINPKMTTVVTSDKDIIFYVNRFKAKVMKSEDFAEMVDKTIKEWAEAQVPEKDDDPVLTEEEVSFWENMFKKRSPKKKGTP
ncbi:MAG TPA: NYN domain-containing protein [Spirochaetota bacterium]|nr:NYN domain-containing protein [Spirochaetota bacterium]